MRTIFAQKSPCMSSGKEAIEFAIVPDNPVCESPLMLLKNSYIRQVGCEISYRYQRVEKATLVLQIARFPSGLRLPHR